MTISYLLAHTSNSLYKFTSVNFFFIHGESHCGVGKSTTCKHLAQVSQINWSFTFRIDWSGQCCAPLARLGSSHLRGREVVSMSAPYEVRKWGPKLLGMTCVFSLVIAVVIFLLFCG